MSDFCAVMVEFGAEMAIHRAGPANWRYHLRTCGTSAGIANVCDVMEAASAAMVYTMTFGVRRTLCHDRTFKCWESIFSVFVSFVSFEFLGGLSLHLNHLIAERVSAPYRQFGTLPIGIFLSNLDSGQLETSLMTSYCHFWNLSTFGDSRAVWVFWPKLGVFRKSKFSRWRSDGASMRLGGVLGSQITRLYDGTIFGGVWCT